MNLKILEKSKKTWKGIEMKIIARYRCVTRRGQNDFGKRKKKRSVKNAG